MDATGTWDAHVLDQLKSLCRISHKHVIGVSEVLSLFGYLQDQGEMAIEELERQGKLQFWHTYPGGHLYLISPLSQVCLGFVTVRRMTKIQAEDVWLHDVFVADSLESKDLAIRQRLAIPV